MSEILPVVRGIIVDDEVAKTRDLFEAFREVGGVVVALAASAREVPVLFESGQINPQTVDVLFVDSNLGRGPGGGKEVVGYLFRQGVLRSPIGEVVDDEASPSDSGRIVTVGTSTEPDWASEVGSYSDRLLRPLIVEWDGRVMPTNMAEIASEVRRLKPRTTS